MRVVLVTGGAGGIGSAVSRAFAKRGWSVAVHAHESVREAESLARELRNAGADACAFFADLRTSEGCESLVRETLERFGRIDALVNNAGISLVKLFSDCSEEDYDEVMDLNFRAAVRLSRLVLPDMLARGAGRIVNLSSMWGESGASCEALYSASKAALIGFTQALGKELARSGVLVNAVAPGAVDTRMNRALGKETLDLLAEETPAGRLARPEEIAACVLFLAEEDSFLVGQTLSPNGGYL